MANTIIAALFVAPNIANISPPVITVKVSNTVYKLSTLKGESSVKLNIPLKGPI